MSSIPLKIIIVFATTWFIAGCGRKVASAPQTPPSEPKNLTAINIASETIQLNWGRLPNATGYNVYMTEAQKNTYTFAGTTRSSFYDQRGLVNGTTYSFMIKAFNAVGESGYSNKVEGIPDIVIINPYQIKSGLYKGAIHLHTKNSDGKRNPYEVAAAYKNGGYDFIVITDHDYLTTFENDPGILTINGVEETAAEGHIVTVGINGQSRSQQAQVIIDEAVGASGLAILAHPNESEQHFYWNYTLDELDNLFNYTGIEIYNHVVQMGKGLGNAEDKWDYLLSNNRNVFGIASDDMHDFASSMGYMGGWVKVFSDQLSVLDIVESMRTGNYFATTGPDLAVDVDSKTISATTDEPATIEFIVKAGLVIEQQTHSISATYQITGAEMYVRARITRDRDGKQAWSNPIFIK